MIRWPQESPAVLPVALATESQRNPVPPWLPADSKTPYQQGLEALTTEDALHNANPAHWLPAYCAHALHNFAEEHLSVLANPDTLASFPTKVVDPLLRSETSKAQEYLQGLLSAADTGYKTVLRRRPVPLTDGPPDDDYIVSLNIASLKSTRLYIDMVYRKIAELPRGSNASFRTTLSTNCNVSEKRLRFRSNDVVWFAWYRKASYRQRCMSRKK